MIIRDGDKDSKMVSNPDWSGERRGKEKGVKQSHRLSYNGIQVQLIFLFYYQKDDLACAHSQISRLCPQDNIHWYKK